MKYPSLRPSIWLILVLTTARHLAAVGLEAGVAKTTITPDVLRKAGVIKTKLPVKILGDGELKVALTVSAHKFSKSAQEKITKAGGKVEVLQ